MNSQNVPDNVTRDPDYLDCLINERGAARFLGVSIRTMQGWRLKGGGPQFVKIGTKAICYRRRDLFAWVGENLKDNTSQFDRPRIERV